VKTLRIKENVQHAPVEPRSRTYPRRNDKFFIGAHADYSRDDFMFRREQSMQMRAAEWESRLKPMKPWGSNLVANLAFEIFA
jgi:hypothetical protein